VRRGRKDICGLNNQYAGPDMRTFDIHAAIRGCVHSDDTDVDVFHDREIFFELGLQMGQRFQYCCATATQQLVR
jgi:hypothetical protein